MSVRREPAPGTLFSAHPKARGFTSSFQYVTLISGQLLALVVLLLLQFVLLTPAQIEAWGWRIPFALGAAGALFALYLRRQLAETETFDRAVQRAGRGDLAQLWRHRRAAFVVFGLTLGGTVAFYTYSTYAQRFLVNTSGFSREQASVIIAAALFIFMLLQPAVGALSDRIGRRPLLIAFMTRRVIAVRLARASMHP